MAPLETTNEPASKSRSKTGFIKFYSLTTTTGADTAKGVAGEKTASATKSADRKTGLIEVPITSVEVTYDEESKFRETTILSSLRDGLKGTISGGQGYKFCTNDGSVVAEHISLASYRNMLNRSPEPGDGLMRVYIVPSTEPGATQSAALLQPPFIFKFIQMGDTAEDALNTGSLHSDTFKGKDPSAMLLSELRKLIPKMSKTTQVHTFCALDGTAAADELPLSKYLELDGNGVQEKGSTPSIIIRYRKTDAKVSAAASKFHGASPEVLAAMQRMKPQLGFKDRSGQELKMDTTALTVKEELQASQFAARDANPRKYTSLMDERDWDSVLRNCSLLYGWKINQTTRQIERASTPAFRLRDKEPPGATLSPSTPDAAISEGQESPMQATPAEPDGKFTPANSPMPSLNGPVANAVTPEPLKADDVHTPQPAKLGAIPSYSINDQSRIEVVNVSSSFQESMAKNHFSASSIEASASGGWGGFSVGATGGASSESSSGQSSANKQMSKKMIASYKFPRVRVFLRPEDLEPTEELQAALNRVKESKNINDLRKIHSTFGQLFCQWATLGGCLQTSKMVTGTDTSLQTDEKEKFKAQVGLAVSTPFGANAEMKASHETQDSTATATKTSHSSEGMTFEATGGNTLLAADPQGWSGSVSDFNNWRIIDQAEPTRIVEAIAQMPGYEHVQSWFYRAVPALSGAVDRVLKIKDQAYLGVDPENPPMPVRSNIELMVPESTLRRQMKMSFHGPIVDMTISANQIDVYTLDALFTPHRAQAPVLVFPSGEKIGTNKDEELLQTVWRLEVAEGYSLGPNSLVCIKSCAPTKHDKSGSSAPELMLSVYRNAQGIFQPSIMSSDEPCFWRLERVSQQPYTSNESLRNGDEVRLTWRFSDQSAGFRDYYDDVYGRRSYTWPTDMSGSVLTFKVPFPRFELSTDKTVSLLMSPVLIGEPFLQTVEIRAVNEETSPKNCSYNLHDLTFRVDCVGDEGYGDSRDFMNVISGSTKKASFEKTFEPITQSVTLGRGFFGGTFMGAMQTHLEVRTTVGVGRDGASMTYALS